MSPELETTILVAAALLLAVFSGSFNAMEVLSLSRTDREEGENGETRGTTRFFDDPVRTGISLVLARGLCAAVVVVSGLRFAENDLFLESEGVHFLAGAFVVLALAVPTIGAKVVALRDPEGFLEFTRVITIPTVYALGPVATVVGRSARRLSPPLMRALSFPVMPLKDKIEAFGFPNGGEVDEEQRIISSVMEFGETRVREVMVPRIDIVAVNVATDRDEAVGLIIDAGHSRIPVYEDTIDRVVGVIYTKDLLRQAVSGEEMSVRGLARPAFFVPESKMIDELLTEFRARRQHLAVVVDEYGGTAGIVTMEDVLEEIVGDIQDEFDTEEALIRRVDDDTVECNAKVRVDELNEELGIELNEEAADSLGGLLYHMIGQIPRVGDTWEHDSLVFEIRSIERQRIEKVVIRGLASVDRKLEDGTV